MRIKERFGSVALITGASSGIGRAFAVALASEGLDLILVARRLDQLNELKVELEKKYAVSVSNVSVDLSESNFMERIDKAVVTNNVDILVNNAGYGTSGKFVDIDGETEQSMIKVNCLAPVILARRFLPRMITRKKGALIFLSSIAANQPTPFGVTYAATKVFDQYIGEALYGELRGSGVSVLTVQPGVTNTGFQQKADYKDINGARKAEDVVRSALKALGRKRVVVDGFSNKVLTLFARILPRIIAIELAKLWTLSNRKKDRE